MVQISYPGVYIEEIPSGVRTIIGVSTSVTAFVGSAKRGPVNRATRVLSFGEYERRFGGLDYNSEMSYAVRQFFMNGGRESWIVRVAKDPLAATGELSSSTDDKVLKLIALDEGTTGNKIEARVDYQTEHPASTFNLFLNFAPTENPTDHKSEEYKNLSMNKMDSRYVLDMVNGVSELVKIERIVQQGTLDALRSGTSIGGELVENGTDLDVANLVNNTHNQFRVSVNGLPPVTVLLSKAEDTVGLTLAARLDCLCKSIQTKVTAAAEGEIVLKNLTCTVDGNRIKMISGKSGEDSTVRILPGERNDVSVRLKLGTLNGGIEADAAAVIRPAEIPKPGILTSADFADTDLDTLPGGDQRYLQIQVDGYGPDTIDLGEVTAAGADLTAKLKDIASRIQTRVNKLKPMIPAYNKFTCRVEAKKLILESGSKGTGSSVAISEAGEKGIATGLHLLTGIQSTHPSNVMLEGGSEPDYKEEDVYVVFTGSRALRTGIYALEAVDLFNLLCLPRVTDSGVLGEAAAYCKERRAFLIIDAPQDKKKPDDMVSTIMGPALPKTEYAAVYYPWIKIPDPLKNGRLRLSAPCGTIAGLYARTDSNRGVWKAPAGTEASLSGVQDVEYLLTDDENGCLNPLGVNCVRVFPVFGPVAWGSRTLRGADQMTSEYKYIPVRRLALFIEETLYRNLKWVVFEPNDEPLWAQIRLNVGAFMHDLFTQGAFQGTTPRDAYFVKCDKETTTQNDINKGIVNIVVGFAPLKPAEFVNIKIQQIAGQIKT